MLKETAPMVRGGRAGARGEDEVRRVRRMYLRRLQRRVRDGSYFTSRRARIAMERLVQSFLDG